MKPTERNYSRKFKPMLVLIGAFLMIFQSCQKEEDQQSLFTIAPKNEFMRKNISYNEFKEKFFDLNATRGLIDPFSSHANKGGDAI